MMNRPVIFCLALSPLLVSSWAFAQEEPSFDCAKAKSRVEKTLCSGGNSGMGDLDNTMADLYKAVSKTAGVDTAALQSSQKAWLAKRNSCKGTENEMLSCLFNIYRARYVELSSGYDKQHLTGVFTNKAGLIDSVLFPDGKLSVNIYTSTGSPAYNSCTATFVAPLKGASVQYTFTPEETGDDEKCTIQMKVATSRADISSVGCRSFCGNSASFDGSYKKQ